MGNVNQDGRVGVWGYDAGRVTDRAASIAAFDNGLITDIFAPQSITLAQADKIRNIFGRSNALHLYEVASGRTASELARDTIADVKRVKASTVELDVEIEDNKVAVYCAEAINAIHKPRSEGGLGANFIITINVAPFKAEFLPYSLLQFDPYVYLSIQLYYGDMSPVSSWEALEEARLLGVPPEKIVPMYGAAGPTKGSERHITIPTIFYHGTFTYHRLKRGRIYQDDLMVDMGLL